MLTSKQAIKERTDEQEPVATGEDVVEAEYDEEIDVRHEETEDRKGQHANAAKAIGELVGTVSARELMEL